MYLIIILFFLFNAVCFDGLKYQRNQNIIYYLEMIILILVAGLRYKVGGDTYMYMVFWDVYPTFSDFTIAFLETSDFNILWDLTTILCKTICSNFVFFQLLHAIFVNIVFFWFFKKYTPYFFTAVLVYTIGHFLYFNTEILRETICICIFMLATPSLLKKNYLKYYLLCLIAWGFHNSAIIMLIAPILLYFKQWDLKKTLLFSILLLVLSSFLYLIASNLINSLNDDIISYKFSHYTESKYSVIGILYQLVQCIPVGLMILLNRKNDSKTAVFNNLLCFLFMLFILSLTFNTIAMRFSNYFIPFYIVFGLDVFMKPFQKDFSNTIHHSLFIKPLIFASVFIIFFNFGHFYLNVLEVKYSLPSYVRYYPYTSVFSKENTAIMKERDNINSSLRNHKKRIDEDEEEENN